MSLQPSVAIIHASDRDDFLLLFFYFYSEKQINYVKYVNFNFSKKNNNYYIFRHILRYVIVIMIRPMVIENIENYVRCTINK